MYQYTHCSVHHITTPAHEQHERAGLTLTDVSASCAAPTLRLSTHSMRLKNDSCCHALPRDPPELAGCEGVCEAWSSTLCRAYLRRVMPLWRGRAGLWRGRGQLWGGRAQLSTTCSTGESSSRETLQASCRSAAGVALLSAGQHCKLHWAGLVFCQCTSGD